MKNPGAGCRIAAPLFVARVRAVIVAAVKQGERLMSRYLMSVFGPESLYDSEHYGYESQEQMAQSMADTDAFNDKLKQQGYFVTADGLDRPSSATVVDGMGEKPMLTDGPFAESKEYMAGFWIIDVPSRDVALQLAAEASKACIGKVEVRPMMEEPE
jgi:hypothetical protein